MLKSDRYLAGIVVAVVALVVVAFILALRQPAAEYRPDGTPDAAVHNYLLALRKRDFERAWTYLSPGLAGYPASVERFTEDVAAAPIEFGLQNTPAAALRVRPSPVVAGGSAVVEVEETQFQQGGLFESGEWTFTFSVTVRRTGDAWRIVSVSPERYWDVCWSDPESSMCKRGRTDLATPEIVR